MLQQAQHRLHFGTVVVGGMIHHQDQGLSGILGCKLLKEGNEGITVFALDGQMRELSGSQL